MRQLPATSNSGTTGTTENSRSRSHPSNDSRVKVLSNGLIKEPIVTRSKSRLKGGRHRLDRSPKKLSSPHKGNDVDQRRKPEKGTGATSRNNSSSSSAPSSPRTEEKMYARHYKSYRGLNGVKSRRAERSIVQEHQSNNVNHRSPKRVEKRGPVDSSANTKRNRVSTQPVLKKSLKEGKNGTTRRNHILQNGLSISPERATRSPSNRIRQLLLKRKKQISNRKLRGDASLSKSPAKERIERSVSPQSRDKAGKRRSALWVLNCEAESFLFGETAAEKHEVELPPLSTSPSPPPKKRRCRATELGDLLEKSPILESKLRKSSSSESGNSDMNREASPPRKRPNTDAQRTPRRVKADKNANSSKKREKTPEMCSSKSVKGNRNQDQQQKISSPKPELLSPIPFLYSPDSIDYEAKTVQFHQMLDKLDWHYSFETPPQNEAWNNTFMRTESCIVSYKSFENPLQRRMVLPYEMDKPFRRSRSKPTRNSRKSPRCHASTLAILSSERPVRSTRNSVTSDSSPTASANNLPSESTLQTLLLPPSASVQGATVATPTSTVSQSTSSPVTTSKLSPVKPASSTSRRRNPSASPTKLHQSDPKDETELGAAQYLWDSIQFLSDPYMVGMLAGDDPANLPEVATSLASLDLPYHRNKFTKTHRCTNNNYVNCPMTAVKHFGKHVETSERKASLRSGDNNPTVNNIKVCTPKSSPRNQSHYGTNNHIGGNSNFVSSPPASPTGSVNDRVPPVNGVTRRFNSCRSPISPPTRGNPVQIQNNHSSSKFINSSKNSKGTSVSNGKGKIGKSVQIVTVGDNGLISHDKVVPKTPVVLVKDLFNGSNKVKARNNNWEEESLFIGDGLPPLPQWPV